MNAMLTGSSHTALVDPAPPGPRIAVLILGRHEDASMQELSRIFAPRSPKPSSTSTTTLRPTELPIWRARQVPWSGVNPIYRCDTPLRTLCRRSDPPRGLGLARRRAWRPTGKRRKHLFEMPSSCPSPWPPQHRACFAYGPTLESRRFLYPTV